MWQGIPTGLGYGVSTSVMFDALCGRRVNGWPPRARLVDPGTSVYGKPERVAVVLEALHGDLAPAEYHVGLILADVPPF